MKVAFFLNNSWVVDSIFNLYPHISFPDTGVPIDFLEENNLYKVVEYINHDTMQKKIITLDTPKLINGKIYTVELIDKTLQEINENKWQKIRSIRNSLLQASDIYILTDRWEKYDQNTKTIWSDYRQQLRDLPTTFTNPDEVVWPIKPV
jgi:hypothetical protein